MPLGERDLNASGRSSRASVMSAGSRGVSKGPPQPTGLNNDLLSANPAVTSMLRTSTELGNLGGIVCESSINMHNVPRAPPPRSGATSRMSTGSSISNTSKRTSGRASAHHNWPSSSSGGPRRSVHRRHHGPQYVADTLSPTVMSLPGSSPLFLRGISRDDHRARSLTYRSHPNLRMSARSLSSLSSEQHIQRPRSPYDGYPPPRFQHSGTRSGSPASDFSEQFSRRPFANPNPPRGMFRGRKLPEIAFRRDQNGRLPLSVRPKSSAYSVNPYDHEERPPVPPIPVQHLAQNQARTQYVHQHKHMHQHIAVDRARSLHSQGKRSVSSGSTNQRTDSDTPSSDGPSPPTPKDCGLMGSLVSTTDAQTPKGHSADRMTSQNEAGPFYLDGSEYYEQEFVHEARAVVLTGCIGRIKVIEEEGYSIDTPKTMSDALPCEPTQASTNSFEGPAELPASPVPHRLTRQLVQSALGPTSPIDDVGVSAPVLDVQTSLDSPIVSQQEHIMAGRSDNVQTTDCLQLDKVRVYRYSTSSQAATSLMESSTVELALQYSGSNNNAACFPDVGPTEDGISDLLDDYQHTETKGHTEPLTETPQEGTAQEDVAEKKSSHTPKSSDEQSFKSCTYLPEEPVKDSDAKSFKTADCMATPECAASMPVSRFPSLVLLKSEPDLQRSTSELPLSPPAAVLRKKPALSLGESSFSRAASRVRPSIKIGSRQGSTATSIASSVSGAACTPPPIPPRESSASTEAQRSTAVANFLARFSLGKAPNTFRKKPSKATTVNPPGECGVNSRSSSYQQEQGSSRSICCFDGTTDAVRTPIKVPVDQEIASENHVPAGVPKRVYHTPIDFEQSRAQNIQKKVFVTPIELENSSSRDIYPGDGQHGHSLSTPPPMMLPLSSAYTPDNGSSFKPRAQSSPARLSKSPEHSPCDSQNTTHLEWHARQSSSTPFFDTSVHRPQTGSEQDDTTTDLPFSSYRRLHVPMSYLEDVKEESHEDSSLNTSTSNLKQRTIFRFSHTGALSSQPSIHESGDETFPLARNASVRSRRNSGLAQAQGLPSMKFSRINLVEGLGDILSSRPGSLEDVLDARESFGLDRLRPSSEGNMREKYKSLLAEIEGVDTAVDISQSGIEQDIIRGRGKAIWSPKEILSALEDITVPTVSEVTRRITELFPPKESNVNEEMDKEEFPEETEIMEHARARLQEVGGPSAKRSSARLRPMAGSSQLQVMEDLLYEKITSPKKKSSVGDGAAGMRTESKGSGAQGRSKHTCEQTVLAELEAPSPAKIRTRSRSLSTSLELASSLQEETRNFRSRTSTPTATSSDTRPWNNDRYYIAWTTSPEIDISFPPPVFLQDSPRPRPSPLRSRLSISSDTSGPSLTCQRVSPATGPFSEALKRPHFHETHQRAPNFDAGGFPTVSVSVRGSDQIHEAGDRYPTSSLSPPSNVNIQSIANYSESDDENMAKKFKFSLRDRFGSKRHSPEGFDGEHPHAAQGLAPNSLDARNGVQDMSKMQDLHEKAKEIAFGKRNTFPQATGMAKREYGAENVMNTVKNFWDKIKSFFTNAKKDHHELLHDYEERGRTKERKGSRIREFLKIKKAPIEGDVSFDPIDGHKVTRYDCRYTRN